MASASSSEAASDMAGLHAVVLETDGITTVLQDAFDRGALSTPPAAI